MIDEERLADLLLAWEERLEHGHDLAVDELCQDSPDLVEPLAERIAILRRMHWLGRQNQNSVTSQKNVQVAKVHDDRRQGASTFRPGMEPVPGYCLIERIGKGAFGEVWSAWSGGKKFAIKFVQRNVNVPDGMVQVERELDGLNRIRTVKHPLILEIRSLSVKNDTLILITELADLSLEKLFAKIRDLFPMVRRCAYALCLLQNIAEALDHLQNHHGLLHLDIKPANLLLVRGICKIGDFGTVFQIRSSRLLNKEVLLTLPSSTDPEGIDTVPYGSCMAAPSKKVFRREATLVTSGGVFTPYYAPPEAFQGKNSRSFDQYSLALTFCELVAGEIPFKGDSQFVQRNEGQMELAFLPEPLRAVIGRALDPKAENRFPSCVAFVTALHEALEPLVQKDKRINNWEGWLLEMEGAAGTKSSDMLPDAVFTGENRRRMPLAGKLLFPLLVVISGGIRAFAFVANKLESLFWISVPIIRNPTIIPILHLAAVVFMCLVLVGVHQNWFGQILPSKDRENPILKDQKKNTPHP